MQSTATAPPASRGGKPRVVIVDDDLAVCNSLKFSLELEGFGVCAYGGAAELFDNSDLAACDCFVIDQRMPGVSGLDLITKLRDLKVQTPVILLTSHPNSSVSARATKAEVPIVEKPLIGNALLDTIRRACGRQ